MVQLSELISAVRDEVQDTGALRWTDSTITRYLNDGQRDLVQISNKINIWQISIPAGTVSINMPSDILIPKNFQFEINTWRYPLAVHYGIPPESTATQGNPQEVYIVGDSIIFYPTVAQAGTLLISGVAQPVDMVNPTDTPVIKNIDSLLIAYAVWQCLMSDGDPLADIKGQYYQQKKMEWGILDAQQNPMPDRIERNWWW